MTDVVFGWAAPSMREQFPQLSDDDAFHFDQDNSAIVRCHVRGLITDQQRAAAFRRLTKKINRALASATKRRAV